MKTRLGHLAAALIGAALPALLGGCAGNALLVASPEAVLVAGEGSAAFLDRVSNSKAVTENDAMRGVLMLVDGQDRAETFKQRVDSLLERRIAAGNWDFDAGRRITKGKLAYMVYEACHVSGGLTLAVWGPSPWYCLKELQYQGFITSGAVYAGVTGMEFVAVMNRADHYMRTGQIPEVLRPSQ